MFERRVAADKAGLAVNRDLREATASNLKRAFPLGDSGSFTGLLRAIDERSR